MELAALCEKLKRFNAERDWDKYHNPKDLLVALVSEVGELAECYRWLSPEEVARVHADPSKKMKIQDELADIFLYLLTLAYKTDTDLVSMADAKLDKNAARYPAKELKGKHTNPFEGIKK